MILRLFIGVLLLTLGACGTPEPAEPRCGDGTLDAGEVCDGDCPLEWTCDDSDACTTEVFSGSADTCDSVCEHQRISQCASDDGCCPSPACAGLDNDCAVAEGEECLSGVSEAEECGPNSNGSRSRSCVEGEWEEWSECSDDDVCVNGATQAGTTPCGVNESGTLRMECVDGQWADQDPADFANCQGATGECTTGTVRTGSTPCGLNGEGLLQEECVAGFWSVLDSADAQNCAGATAECTNDVTRSGTVCGINNEGYFQQRCVEGVWVEGNECSGEDVCVNGGPDEALSCGAEGTGEQTRSCAGGQWTDWGACVVCAAGTQEELDCGLNDSGKSSRWCTDSGWGIWTDCTSTDICTNGESKESACGINNDGVVVEVCANGQWNPPLECVDPDTCVNGASKLTDIMCVEGGEQGLLYRDCSLGQWVDRTGPGGCELDIPCQASQVDNSKLYSQPGSLTSVLFGEVVVDCADGYEGGGPWVCDAQGQFSGEECSDIDECAGNPCQNGGVCTNGINSYTCTCAAGYLGDDCSDVDECATNPCQNGGVCEDGEDSYTCSCVPGYSGATCQTNIDECAGNPCGSGEVCVDGVYSYTCECAAGYAAGGANDTGCVNINECTTGTDDCSAGQECNDTVGSYLCEEPVCSCSGGKHAEGTDCTSTGELCTHCDFGYKLDDDGTCVNFDECSLGTSWLKSHIVSGGGQTTTTKRTSAFACYQACADSDGCLSWDYDLRGGYNCYNYEGYGEPMGGREAHFVAGQMGGANGACEVGQACTDSNGSYSCDTATCVCDGGNPITDSRCAVNGSSQGCSSCNTGRYFDANGNDNRGSCEVCSAGYYQANAGNTTDERSCISCATLDGEHISDAGAASCTECQPYTWAWYNNTECTCQWLEMQVKKEDFCKYCVLEMGDCIRDPDKPWEEACTYEVTNVCYDMCSPEASNTEEHLTPEHYGWVDNIDERVVEEDYNCVGCICYVEAMGGIYSEVESGSEAFLAADYCFHQDECIEATCMDDEDWGCWWWGLEHAPNDALWWGGDDLAWTCPSQWFGDNNHCDCGCGSLDPDCFGSRLAEDCGPYNDGCAAGFGPAPQENTLCVPDP